MSDTKIISPTFQLNPDMQNVSEAWESIADLAAGRVKDNAIVKEYPLMMRKRQLKSLKVLVKLLEDSHEKMANLPEVKNVSKAVLSTDLAKLQIYHTKGVTSIDILSGMTGGYNFYADGKHYKYDCNDNVHELGELISELCMKVPLFLEGTTRQLDWSPF